MHVLEPNIYICVRIVFVVLGVLISIYCTHQAVEDYLYVRRNKINGRHHRVAVMRIRVQVARLLALVCMGVTLYLVSGFVYITDGEFLIRLVDVFITITIVVLVINGVLEQRDRAEL